MPKSHCIPFPGHHYFGYMSLGSERDSWSPRGRNLHTWDLIFKPDLHPSWRLLIVIVLSHPILAREALRCWYIKPLCVRLMPDDIPCASGWDEIGHDKNHQHLMSWWQTSNISSRAASILCDLCALPLSKATASNEPGVNTSYSFRFRFTLYFVLEHHIVFFTLRSFC